MSSTENAGKTMLTTDLKTNYDPETYEHLRNRKYHESSRTKVRRLESQQVIG